MQKCNLQLLDTWEVNGVFGGSRGCFCLQGSLTGSYQGFLDIPYEERYKNAAIGRASSEACERRCCVKERATRYLYLFQRNGYTVIEDKECVMSNVKYTIIPARIKAKPPTMEYDSVI